MKRETLLLYSLIGMCTIIGYTLFHTYKLHSIEGYEDTYTVVLVEPRLEMQEATEFVIQNALDNLSIAWNIIIFPGGENIGAVRAFAASLPQEKQTRITIQDIGLKSMTIQEYNDLMMSKRLLDIIPTEVFLVIQTDSLICSSGKDLVNEFIKYDYVGAPWVNWNTVGNGGFSLRRKSKMLEILGECPKMNQNEDTYFSAGCHNIQVSKPSAEEAQKFSVETIYEGKQMFGVHKAWVYQSESLDHFESKCPGFKKIRDLN